MVGMYYKFIIEINISLMQCLHFYRKYKTHLPREIQDHMGGKYTKMYFGKMGS